MLEDLEDHVMVLVEEEYPLQILVDLLIIVPLVELILVLVEPQEIQMAVLEEVVDQV
jgi:hypothetical protein